MATVVHLKPLLPIFSFIGVLPPINFNNNCVKLTKSYIIKVSALVLLFTIFSIASVIARTIFLEHRPTPYKIVDGITTVLLWLLVILSLIYSCIHHQLYGKLFRQLNEIHKECHGDFRIKCPMLLTRKFIFILICQFLIMLWYYKPPNWMWTERYWIGIICYFHEEAVFHFYATCMAFLVVSLLKISKQDLKELRFKLQELRGLQIYEERPFLNQIKSKQKTFTKLHTITRILNHLFIPTFLCIPLTCRTWLLQFFLYIIHMINDYSTTVEYQLASFCFGLMFVMVTFLILLACDEIMQESKKLMITCYDLQDCISIYSEPYQELQRFTEKISKIKIKFSALGFFEVNKGLVFPIVGSVATYFFVIEQFWNRN
ncbi:hypothetical protein ABEB36_003292 [Hypothenemus hampei]|uniref:Gustatory receptor n=1 Tax=Hypothenemus hampei TaxID=57062 RepID=A0ABD1F8N3_HYPHA